MTPCLSIDLGSNVSDERSVIFWWRGGSPDDPFDLCQKYVETDIKKVGTFFVLYIRQNLFSCHVKERKH